MKSLFKKLVSIFISLALAMSPVFVFAIDIYDPSVDESGGVASSTYTANGSNYTGVSDVTKAVNDPAAQKSRLSCNKAVPAAQRAILGLQYAKQDPTKNDTLLTIFNNVPALLGGINATQNSFKDGKLTPEASKSWQNFGSNSANMATFGQYNKNQIKKAEAVGDTSRVQELLEQERFRVECLDSIKISIATNLLDRGTSEMISLVQTGNFGDPMYVVNGQEWMQRVQDQTIVDIFMPDLSARYSGQNLSNPYALTTIKNIISNSRDTSFQERTNYTLGSVLLNAQNRYGTGNGINNVKLDINAAEREKEAQNNFRKDFNQGGWAGWSALTQNPANNPIGYSILAVNEIASKKDKKEKATQLENNPQLLSKIECVEETIPAVPEKCIEYTNSQGQVVAYENIDVEDMISGVVTCTKTSPAVPSKSNTRGVKAKPTDPNCKKTKVVTPGSLITERMKWFVTSDIRQLELADKFNSSISQILTASINKITQKGLDSIASNTRDAWNPANTSSLRQYSSSRLNFLKGGNKTNVQYKGKDYELFLDTNSPFWNDDFNLERELNDIQIGCEIKKGLYNTQKEYVDELEYMKNPKTTPLTHVIPAVAILDMCVPGPTAIWQDLSDPFFAEYVDAVSAKDPQQLSSPDLAFTKVTDLMTKHAKTAGGLGMAGSLTSSIAPALPPPANGIGMVVGAGLNISSAIVKNKKIDGLKPGDYSAAIATFQQYTPMVLEDEAYRNKDIEITDTINAYENYIQYVYNTYSDTNNLPVAAKARPVIGNLVEKNENINATMQAYESEYVNSVAVLNELASIKKETDAIYATARARMATKYPDVKDEITGATVKWNDVPKACTQICTVVKPTIPKPNFVEIDMLIAGFKLNNGIWGSSKSLRETLAGLGDTFKEYNGNIDMNVVNAGTTSSGSGTKGGSPIDNGLFNNAANINTNNNQTSSAGPDTNGTNSDTPSILYFTSDVTTIDIGNEVNLEWSLLNATNATLTASGSSKIIKSSNLNGDTIVLSPNKTTTYILTVKNDTKQVTKQLKITVNQ